MVRGPLWTPPTFGIHILSLGYTIEGAREKGRGRESKKILFQITPPAIERDLCDLWATFDMDPTNTYTHNRAIDFHHQRCPPHRSATQLFQLQSTADKSDIQSEPPPHRFLYTDIDRQYNPHRVPLHRWWTLCSIAWARLECAARTLFYHRRASSNLGG